LQKFAQKRPATEKCGKLREIQHIAYACCNFLIFRVPKKISGDFGAPKRVEKIEKTRTKKAGSRMVLEYAGKYGI
jgi:hypothetical protein